MSIEPICPKAVFSEGSCRSQSTVDNLVTFPTTLSSVELNYNGETPLSTSLKPSRILAINQLTDTSMTYILFRRNTCRRYVSWKFGSELTSVARRSHIRGRQVSCERHLICVVLTRHNWPNGDCMERGKVFVVAVCIIAKPNFFVILLLLF